MMPSPTLSVWFSSYLVVICGYMVPNRAKKLAQKNKNGTERRLKKCAERYGKEAVPGTYSLPRYLPL